MVRVLFVCWGNICRSPMAEYMLKDLASRRGLEDEFYIESAATSTEEIGNPVYPPAVRELAKHGISCGGHRARQVRSSDYDKFDYIIGMESIHLRLMRERFFSGDPQNKLYLMMDFTERPGSQVADPWYSGDFEATYEDIREALEGFVESVMANRR